MREIKYRIPWINGDGSFIGFTYWGRIDHKSHSSSECFTSPGQWGGRRAKPDEQFTGLRDKSGREIYEGDILLGVLATAGRGAVTRKEKSFHFSIVWRAPSFHLSAIDRYSNSTYRWYPAFNECEVVGNIHKNPELLEAAR